MPVCLTRLYLTIDTAGNREGGAARFTQSAVIIYLDGREADKLPFCIFKNRNNGFEERIYLLGIEEVCNTLASL